MVRGKIYLQAALPTLYSFSRPNLSPTTLLNYSGPTFVSVQLDDRLRINVRVTDHLLPSAVDSVSQFSYCPSKRSSKS